MRTHALFQRIFQLVLFTLLAQASVAHATLLVLQPDSTSVQNGDSISLQLMISGLGNFGPDSLGAFDISIGFDPGVLSFASYNPGGFLGNLGLFEAIDASSGNLGSSVNISVVSLLSATGLDVLQPGEFSLATLRFDVSNLAIGATTQLSILSGAVLANAGGFALPVTLGLPAVIEDRAFVPIPGTALLLLGALFGWLIMLRMQAPHN